MPITACDTSRSLYRGNIYIVWGDQRNGTSNTDVFFIKSTDNGTTWSGFKKVNDDNTDRHQFFPWMTIDQSTGFIYVVFYDRRGTTGSATDVYVACSRDGGTTFENIKVSQSSFTPSSGVFFGDYTNIAAVDRKIRPIWMRMDNSSLSVWTALMTDTVAVSGAPVLVSPANNAINIPQVVSCSWGQVSNATAYHLQIASDPVFNTIVYNDSIIAGVTVQTPALANNTKYYWRVRAKVNSSYSMWSAVWNFSIGSNCIDVVTTSNWNLISIPLTVANPAVSTLFPNANSPAYAYNNGYQVASQLVQGQGYWLKFPGEFTNTVCGQITQPQTVSIAAGWNLIGPFHSQVSTTQLQTVPPGILNSSIYGYQGNYSLVNTLLPGKGYWIKASQAGTLSFTVTGKGSVTELAEIEKLKKITITDADGKTGTLYINDKAAKDNLWELPPVPPVEVFDVRFSSHLLAENISEPQNIQMQGFSNPVTIRTEEPALDVFNTVTGKFVGKVTAGQPLTINLNNMNSLAVQQSQTAMDFSLMQNYPNPFNPSTTIGFILPQSGKITLKVYNMLGEEIVTLFEGVKEAGEHEVEFDGKNLQSGMYIYRLSYGNTHVSKTMALIK
ncbi:MAG: T9SS type A sorting domain-containing protein [Ignavibacteriales bacterium]|nr:T9SS type A sorting domain-containing protein [Ignavibacteriales bacterium]